MEFQVFRSHTSEYLGADFLTLEKQKLEKITKVQYLENKSQIDPKKPLILLGSSQSNYNDYNQDNIKLVIHANSGFDNVDLNWCESLRAPIVVGHEIRDNAVCEYILSALFAHYSLIPKTSHWDRTWNRSLIAEQKILIIGFGHIGKKVFKSLHAICKDIVIYDPFKGFESNLEDQFDVIINSASLNPSSYELIDKNFLKKLKTDGLLINPARGKIIKQTDLIEHLQNHPETHAVLDVFETEPVDHHLFKDLINLKTTSHLAGVYTKIKENVLNFEHNLIENFLNLDEQSFNDKYHDEILGNRIIHHNKQKMFI